MYNFKRGNEMETKEKDTECEEGDGKWIILPYLNI